MMFGGISAVMLPVLLGASAATGGLRADENPTTREQALRDWVDAYQTHARGICERISVPLRREAEDQIVRVIERLAGSKQQKMDASGKSLGKLSEHGGFGRIGIPAWGPSLEQEVTRRQGHLIQAWDRMRNEHTPERVVTQARKYSRTLDKFVTEWRQLRVDDGARLARLERAHRERALTGLARRYAVNWLLGGHPESYLPPEWTGMAKRSKPTTSGCSLAKDADERSEEEFQEMRKLIRDLTDELVAVGIGDFRSGHVVQVERYLESRRHRMQTMMAALTGRHSTGREVRLVQRR